MELNYKGDDVLGNKENIDCKHTRSSCYKNKQMKDIIYITLPKLTEEEVEIFKGPMHKALLAGINVTKKAVSDALLNKGIKVEFK
ncbi:hypothetical protein [Escherichia coli]|uniref:hypothetical protein n=1 Tax=Escherichia coli TaxID=562 RepID=UPI0020C95F0A|nr:hypothetical protein [Escherichia coli]EIH4402100.1 hypothetical protein [Escherichia coli]UTP17226.1 hypothetical protein NML24_17135 [Escherichia coli]